MDSKFSAPKPTQSSATTKKIASAEVFLTEYKYKAAFKVTSVTEKLQELELKQCEMAQKRLQSVSDQLLRLQKK